MSIDNVCDLPDPMGTIKEVIRLKRCGAKTIIVARYLNISPDLVDRIHKKWLQVEQNAKPPVRKDKIKWPPMRGYATAKANNEL